MSKVGFAVLLGIGTAGLFFGNLASGSKAYIMFSFLPVIWFFLLQPKLRLWALAAGACLAIFYLSIVAPVVHRSRHNPLEQGSDPRAHMIESFNDWVKRPEDVDQNFFFSQLDQFVNRQFDSVSVGFIVSEVNQTGFKLGESMEYASYAFIPRVIWPDKPTVTRGAWFSEYLGVYGRDGEINTSIGMTAVGELYWNFGAPGVVIGMFVFGCLTGLLWRMASSDPRGKPIHMVLYVAVMISITDMPEAVTVLASLVATLITFKITLVGIDVIKGLRNRRTHLIVGSRLARIR